MSRIECRLKNECEIYTGNSISDSDKDKYLDDENSNPYISTKDIDISTNKVNYDGDMYIKKTDKSFKIAPNNSCLLCIEGGSAGKKITYLSKDVCFVNKLCCIKAKVKNRRYYYWFLQSDSFKSEFNLNLSGLIGGVSQQQLKNLKLITCSIEEQIQIATFLDKKCSNVDKIIKENKKSIGQMEEYKNTLITKYTTENNGKNFRIKTICNKITDGAHVSPDTNKGAYAFVSVVDLKEGKIDFENCLTTSEESYEQLIRNNCNPKKGDILLSKDGSVGKTAIINFDKNFVVASSLVILRPNKDVLVKYLDYFLRNNYIQDELKSYLTGSGLKRVSIEKNKNLRIIIPPLNEQQKISLYLDNKCGLIDKVVEQRKKLVIQLEEYKKSLIYEAITGKIEV